MLKAKRNVHSILTDGTYPLKYTKFLADVACMGLAHSRIIAQTISHAEWTQSFAQASSS